MINIGQASRHTKPANQLRCGKIKATIWQNVSEKGPFFATTFSRPFKDQSGTWRNGTSFGLNDFYVGNSGVASCTHTLGDNPTDGLSRKAS